MRPAHLLRAAAAVAAAEITGRCTPLVVGWALDNRCAFHCRYCNVWRTKSPTLGTAEALTLLDEMARQGTIKVGFTGGEPLLRDDLGVLVRRCGELGISATLCTSGYGLARRIDELGPVEGIALSVDGPRELNDHIRGEGAYDAAVEALAVAHARGLHARISTVVSRGNVDRLDHVLRLAARYGASVLFQPPTANVLRGTAPNPMVPDTDRYRAAIAGLMRWKRAGLPELANSMAGLRHMARYPGPAPVRCVASRLMCRVDPAGYLKSCTRLPDHPDPPNAARSGFAAAFRALGPGGGCPGCWCASHLELNLLMSFHPSVLGNLKHLV